MEFGGWQTVARFYGASVGVEWTKPIERDGAILGYEAKAIVQRHGNPESSAEAMCTRDEKNWASRDEFALRSMAQTRACAKALRNYLAWVAVLAGFRATPAEEVDGIVAAQAGNGGQPPASETPAPAWRKPREASGAKEPIVGECADCGNGITQKVLDYSNDKYGKFLCFTCQKKQ